ncbi:FecCD family ABC transporter permease [Enteractinococcus helveticum]|uniref:ABC transporter permease n=1 Tax=Enteractinococcus helveticum TaxID=1837282 RepID=A0A1B7M1A5_9MICC|nr:iron ABC transporter permease [Enteractinococcus helveticum]OAV62361.1 ABC transporter permease [Enteractinococcus helveticum]
MDTYQAETIVDDDVLGVNRQRRHALTWMLALVAATLASLILGVAIGAVYVPPEQIVGILGHRILGLPSGSWTAATEAIVWDVRLPRVILGLSVGAGLAICGMALQAMVRNMLADPYLLGINSGASTGAAAAILFGVGAGLGEHALQGSAFLGALAASVLLYSIARSGGRVTSVRLLLAGVTVGYALYALTSFLIFASGSAEGARSVMFWLLGSLALADWGTPLLTVVVITVFTAAVLTLFGRSVDVLAIGDDTSLTLGISPEKLRTVLLVLVALCIGVLVSASGSIGFVGLVVPHLARRAVGSTHSRAFPVAALMGGILLIWADLVARTVLAPQEIPIGILTAMVGAPFLLILIRRLHANR